MRKLMLKLRVWLGHNPLRADPVWRELDRREQDGRRLHRPVRHIQRAKAQRINDLLRGAR
jgi:hypothetical protein